jgi:hypothetical protein
VWACGVGLGQARVSVHECLVRAVDLGALSGDAMRLSWGGDGVWGRKADVDERHGLDDQYQPGDVSPLEGQLELSADARVGDCFLSSSLWLVR